MPNEPKLTVVDKGKTEAKKNEYWLWLYQDLETYSEVEQLPGWFNLDKYKSLRNFSPDQWSEALLIRKEMEIIVSDFPPSEDPAGPHAFLNELLLHPLNPDFTLWPSIQENIEGEIESISNWIDTGVHKRWNHSFNYNLCLSDKVLVACFKRLLKAERALLPPGSYRVKKIDYKQWVKLNMLALIDLRLWGGQNRVKFRWKLILNVIDPYNDMDESVIRKQISNFYDFYDGSNSNDILVAQNRLID